MSEMMLTCYHCNGTGISPETSQTCHVCQGSGEVEARGDEEIAEWHMLLNRTKVEGIETKLDDIDDKLNDIMDKCNDIFEQVSE